MKAQIRLAMQGVVQAGGLTSGSGDKRLFTPSPTVAYMEEVCGFFKEVSAFRFSPELWGDLPGSAAGMPGLSMEIFRYKCIRCHAFTSPNNLHKLGRQRWQSWQQFTNDYQLHYWPYDDL